MIRPPPLKHLKIRSLNTQKCLILEEYLRDSDSFFWEDIPQPSYQTARCGPHFRALLRQLIIFLIFLKLRAVKIFLDKLFYFIYLNYKTLRHDIKFL